MLAAHINHGLRGEASDADEAWLHEQCRDLGVPLRTERADAAAAADEQGDGLEAAARTVRYELLARIAERTGCRFVATAHTKDDVVETVLFRFLRGSGLRGLAGIPRRRILSPSVTLVRPLLDCARTEVLAYLASIGQPYRHDATNDELRFARNRIRGELLPYLRENFNPDVDGAIARTAAWADETQATLDAMAGELLASCRRLQSDASARSPPQRGFLLATGPLGGHPPLLVAEALRQAWREANLPEQAMSRHWWVELTRFALSGKSPPLNLPADLRATKPTPLLLLVAPARRPS
ncbi:MAG: tRNA lysidine(34) synthetase TilS [Planctomycetota bacterium]|nr:MAG: tRNA lysidine(34) synthetase TilS [Planctomycetota bacterium]